MSAEKETSGAVGRSWRNPKRIYLSPMCDGFPDREWCEVDGGPCEECGEPWVAYDMTPTAHPQERANPSPPHAEKLKGAEAPSINESIYWSKEDTYDAPPTPTPETNSNE